jgi:hypothetical protein
MGGAPLTPSPPHSVVFEPVPLPSGDSVISAPQSNFPSNPRPPPPITSVKDKPSDMGLKNIMVIIPGDCTASAEAETYDSGDESNYKGKYEGAFYAGTSV